MVLPQAFGGIYVPKIGDALDLTRFDELGKNADLALNLWNAFALAVERGDSEIAKHHAKQIAILTRSAIALVNRLGQAEPDTPFGRDAKAWREERDNGQ
jgi:hypothetical protein